MLRETLQGGLLRGLYEYVLPAIEEDLQFPGCHNIMNCIILKEQSIKKSPTPKQKIYMVCCRQNKVINQIILWSLLLHQSSVTDYLRKVIDIVQRGP